MQIQSLYQEIILDHYRNPHHKGLREPFDAEVHHVNPTCGDEVTMRVALKDVDGDPVVTDVSYDALGCSISQASASVMSDLVIGKPVGEGTFARRVGESKSYTVEPAITVEPEARAWIDTQLIDIPASSIQSVELKPGAGAGYTLHRIKPKEEGFALDKPPTGRTALDAKALAPSVSTLSGLTIEDVAAAKDIDFGQSAQAVFTLEDGTIVTVTGAAAGDKRWIEVQSSKDPALAQKAKDHAFQIASYRYDAIFRPLDQLLVPKETKPRAGAGASKSGAAHPVKSPPPPTAP